jgi:hypothetical protein
VTGVGSARSITEPETTNPKEKTMSATATMTNGKSRKQLSDEIDRLDGVIDVLAEGLPGAVTDACREGARAAVKDAILEIVTNPELRALLAPAQPAPATVVAAPELAPEPEPPTPGPWARIKAGLAAARDAVAARCKAARDAIAAAGTAAGEAIPARRILLVGLGVGAVAGVACLVMPQTLAAVVTAVTTAATAVAVQAGTWLKRAARRVGLLS